MTDAVPWVGPLAACGDSCVMACSESCRPRWTLDRTCADKRDNVADRTTTRRVCSKTNSAMGDVHLDRVSCSCARTGDGVITFVQSSVVEPLAGRLKLCLISVVKWAGLIGVG